MQRQMPEHIRDGSYSSSTTLPCPSVMRRSMRAASSWLWVAISAASFEARTSLASAVENVAGGLRVEVAGRLVGEQQPRRIGDGAGDGDALLLAAGQLRRPVRRPLLDPHIGEELHGALLGELPRRARG